MKDMKIMKDMKAALTWRPPAAPGGECETRDPTRPEKTSGFVFGSILD
jgi:hypothetical protein